MFKKIILPLVCLSTAFAFSSCSEDFDIAAPYKNITAVYGMLNITDTAHYVRIQKAFLDENTSALEMAKEPDSNFYANLTVTMEEITGSGNVVATFPLEKVTVDKDPGQFFQQPQFVYKFKRNLDPRYTYKLKIDNPSTGKIITATTQIIDTAARSFNIPLFGFANNTVGFARADDDFKVQVLPSKLFEPGKNKYLEGFITFRYTERNDPQGTTERKSLEWKFATTIATEAFNLAVKNREFYSFLSANIQPDANIRRVLDSAINIKIWMAGADYANYLLVTTAQSGGLTSGQISPVFSNLIGDDALGIFHTRAFRQQNILLNLPTRDSVLKNATIKNLNFVSQF